MGDTLERRIVYMPPGLDAVEVKRDLNYDAGGPDPLLMDVYSPPRLEPGAQLPAILFIHGGPISPDLVPKPKDWGVYVSYGQLAASSGLVGVTFNHRYHSLTNLEQSAGDIQSALQYIRKNAGDLNVDPDRLGLWAFSGGGPQLSFALREPLPYLRALASFYAVLDLRGLGSAEAQRRPGVSAEMLERFSPLAYLEGDRLPDLPILIGRAGRDDPRLNAGVDAFIARALSGNLQIAVLNHPQGRHSFDVLDDDDRSREIIATAIAFFRWHLLGENS